MLRAYVGAKPTKWERYLPILEFAYNNSKHTSKGYSAFMLIDTKVNIVDCLTKPLPDQRFRALRTKLGLQQETELKRAEGGAKGKSKI